MTRLLSFSNVPCVAAAMPVRTSSYATAPSHSTTSHVAETGADDAYEASMLVPSDATTQSNAALGPVSEPWSILLFGAVAMASRWSRLLAMLWRSEIESNKKQLRMILSQSTKFSSYHSINEACILITDSRKPEADRRELLALLVDLLEHDQPVSTHLLITPYSLLMARGLAYPAIRRIVQLHQKNAVDRRHLFELVIAKLNSPKSSARKYALQYISAFISECLPDQAIGPHVMMIADRLGDDVDLIADLAAEQVVRLSTLLDDQEIRNLRQHLQQVFNSVATDLKRARVQRVLDALSPQRGPTR